MDRPYCEFEPERPVDVKALNLDTREVVTLRLSKSTWTQIATIAAAQQRDLSDIADDILTEYAKDHLEVVTLG